MKTLAKVQEDRGLTVGETTREFGGYEGHTYSLLRAGKLPGARKVNGRWLIPAKSVREHLRRRKEREAKREAEEIPA